MGSSKPVTFTVELVIQDESGSLRACTASEWRVRARYGNLPGYGKPTLENLTKYVSGFEASTQPQGCNQHLGVQKVISAFIKDQRCSTIVATYGTAANRTD